MPGNLNFLEKLSKNVTTELLLSHFRPLCLKELAKQKLGQSIITASSFPACEKEENKLGYFLKEQNSGDKTTNACKLKQNVEKNSFFTAKHENASKKRLMKNYSEKRKIYEQLRKNKKEGKKRSFQKPNPIPQI